MKKIKKERNLKFTDGKWYVDFTFNKKRIRKFGGYTKEQARNTLAKLRIEKLDEKLGYKKPNREDIAFEKFADEFIELYAKQNKKSWTRDEFSLKHLKPFFKGKSLQDIGPELVERYKAKRKTEVSSATTNRELALLKTIFNKAVEWDRIEVNPALKVKLLKESNTKERILTEGEAGRLIEVASPKIKPILIIALNTGMRRNEILGLKWENVNFIKSYILIEDSKSGKSRRIPMNYSVFETLKELPRNSEYIFFNPETKIHIKSVKTAFKTACSNADIQGLRFHDLRHSAGSMMVEAGIDLVTVSKILGHSSIQMTMRYVHPTPQNMKRAVDKLGEIFGQTRQKVDTVKIKKPATHLFLDN